MSWYLLFSICRGLQVRLIWEVWEHLTWCCEIVAPWTLNSMVVCRTASHRGGHPIGTSQLTYRDHFTWASQGPSKRLSHRMRLHWCCHRCLLCSNQNLLEARGLIHRWLHCLVLNLGIWCLFCVSLQEPIGSRIGSLMLILQLIISHERSTVQGHHQDNSQEWGIVTLKSRMQSSSQL